MAAASYTTDLASYESWETVGGSSSSLVEMNNFLVTQQNTFETADPDNPIQGTIHASVAQRNTGAGSIVANRPTGVSLANGECFFIWATFLQARAIDTFSNAGLVGFVGTGTGAYYNWTIGGNDFGRNPYGGYANYVIDPTISTGRSQVGGPGTTYDHVGFGCNVISAINRGNPYNLDAIYYGRGELFVTDGDLANGYANFEAIATQNDNNANRWGLFQEQFGSYLWKGLLNLGNTTSVDFRDANKVIFIDNTPVVQSSFNRIEVRGASSNIDWDNINISTLGITGPTNGTTSSRGEFEMIDGATLDFDTCVFTDMSTFIFNKGTGACDIKNTTFRRCNQVTQGGATFTNCLFDSTEADVALLSTDATANNIDNCEFVGDNTSHAINLGNVTSSTSITWNSTFDTTTYATVNQAQSASSSSGDSEVILVNVSSGQTLTISVSGGTTPTYRNTGGGTVEIVQTKLLTVNNIQVDTELRLYSYTDLANPNTYTELAGIEQVGTVTGGDSGFTTPILANGVYSTTFSYDTSGGNTPVLLVAHALNFEFFRESFTLTASENTSFTVFQISDRQYDAGTV